VIPHHPHTHDHRISGVLLTSQDSCAMYGGDNDVEGMTPSKDLFITRSLPVTESRSNSTAAIRKALWAPHGF